VASEMSSSAFGGSEDRRDAGLEQMRDTGEHGPVRDEPNY